MLLDTDVMVDIHDGHLGTLGVDAKGTNSRDRSPNPRCPRFFASVDSGSTFIRMNEMSRLTSMSVPLKGNVSFGWIQSGWRRIGVLLRTSCDKLNALSTNTRLS